MLNLSLLQIKMIESLLGRDKVSPHKIADKVNEIIDVLNSAEGLDDEAVVESVNLPEISKEIKKEKNNEN